MCRVLEISESGYYRWRQRQRQPSRRSQENEQLLASIRGIMVDSKWTYGAPRVAAQLRNNGIKVSVNRVARLMREAGLSASVPKKYVPSTRRGARAHGIEDRVNRQFDVAEPDQLWVADATCLHTLNGKLYLAVVQDACSRRILGWAMKTCQDVGLTSQALQMALRGRRCKGVTHPSDQGKQYGAKAFQALCRAHGIEQSMGSVGDCYDNAQAESWFATLKRESVLSADPLKSAQALRLQIIRYIESWYNTRRLHSSLGYMSPIDYEAQLKKTQSEFASAQLGGSKLSNTNVSTKTG